MSKIVEVVNYTDRAIALFAVGSSDGTKYYKKTLLDADGKFNPSLKNGESRVPGWIFPKSKKEFVDRLAMDINSGIIKPDNSLSSSSSSSPINHQAFLALVSRVEALEQELRLMKNQLSLPASVSNITFDDEEEEDKPGPRLLKKK